MTVQRATLADTDALRTMARRFLSADGPYGDRFALDEGRFEALVQQMVSSDASLTLIARDEAVPIGMFGAFLFTHPITGERIAAELCWWMEPEARGGRVALQMLRDAERWATEQGATVLEMIAPDDHVAAFYGRIGYERTDVHYRKAL